MSRVEPVPAPYPARASEGARRHHAARRATADALHDVGARSAHLDRFRAGSLLDRGPVSLRHREIVIDRTCARCGCAYEWGVHVAFFAQRVTLTPAQLHATVHGDSNDPVWSDEERLLIRMVDELHDSASLSDDTWAALAATFSDEQILELIALVGFYHSVSFFANGLKLSPEARGVPFPPA